MAGALWLTLANPPANALSEALLDALQSALDQARDDASVRVVVIAAEGKLFSGGHDLKEMNARRSETRMAAAPTSRISSAAARA